MAKKTDYKKLEKKLTMKAKNCWEVWSDGVAKKAMLFAEGYKSFLNSAKIEREVVLEGIKLAKKKGFVDVNSKTELKAGDKVYFVNRDKNLLLARIGKKSIDNGIKLIMSHIDSPGLDLKIRPLYEDEGIAFFKTHYYGGIKKHQWSTIAMALHGIVYLKGGEKVSVVIGENEKDPVFMITDLLVHLDRAGGPGSKAGAREVKAEDLNLVVGSKPVKDDKIKEKVKLGVLEFLYNNYKITEEDFASAELRAVPSEKARDLGFDKSMVSAYGQDDKICAYSSLQAFLDARASAFTQVCVFDDREEIGSEGNTGAKSLYLEVFISKLLNLLEGQSSMDKIFNIFSKSKAISADVTAALDPDYKDAYDIKNAQKLNYGLAVEKYTGSGGKYSASEASSKFVRELLDLFDKNKNLIYQITGGLGKVDQGGGGTISKFLANRGMEVVDSGVPLFNMHAPLEISSKADMYSSYLAFKDFFEN